MGSHSWDIHHPIFVRICDSHAKNVLKLVRNSDKNKRSTSTARRLFSRRNCVYYAK